MLYLISLNNYLLFHTVVELFSVYIAYVIFLIVWKSRTRLENRYLIILGIGYFFIGSVDFLHALAFNGMGVLPEFNTNFTDQLWIVARFLESISFLVAPLFLIRNEESLKKNTRTFESATFAWKVFFAYTVITVACLLSIFFFRDFLDFYIEGSGSTLKVISEYMISVILFCSLILLYTYRDMFEEKVFRLLAVSIVLTFFGELPFITYSHMDEFPGFIGYSFKLLSFYLVYKAVVDIGFEEPCSFLFKELKSREEDFRQKAISLGDEYNYICKLIGVNKYPAEHKNKNLEGDYDRESYHSFMQHFPGIGFQLDNDFVPVSIHGPVEEMTGYRREDIISGKVDLMELIVPEDQPLIFKKRDKLKSNPKFVIENEFRIRKKNGEIKWVREITQEISSRPENSGKYQSLIYDITERKMTEEALLKIDRIRIKEVHHRIKNNLQVISSLLSLQAEKFEDEKVIEAFKESQKRIESIAMIHEKLHEGEGIDSLDFADYLRKLTTDLFSSYRVGNDSISLKLELEQVYLGMDTAIPLGIIVNELISNSLKHAFPDGMEGEIHINLCKMETFTSMYDISDPDRGCLKKEDFRYILTVKDNGKGIPEEIDFQNANSLGLQLINILVEQLGGCIELKRSQGTEYVIGFSNESN